MVLMRNRFHPLILCFLLGLSSLVFSGLFTERPRWNQRNNQTKTNSQQTQMKSEPSKPTASSKQPAAAVPVSVAQSVSVSTNANTTAIRDAAQKTIQKKDYVQALEIFSSIPEGDKTQDDFNVMQRLSTILTVRENEKNQPALLKSDNELDSSTLKMVLSLYSKAENFYALGQQELAKDFLLHTLFLHRRYFNAREFLKLGYGLAPGNYKVEDVQNKYWKQSEVYFYGGNYERALNVLDTLTYFDKENYKVYERIGSSYYMLGEKKKALEALTTSLFLHPGDAQLEEIIKQTKQFIEDDQHQAEEAARNAATQKVEKKEELVQTETQLLGVFPTQTQAYAYAQKLREQKLTAAVEELDNGKWAVKVPKSQLSKRTTP